jgi:hypothetical protein
MRLCPRCHAATRGVTQFDEADWLDFDQDVIDELDAEIYAALEDTEYAQGQVPPVATDEVAARILAAALQAQAPGVRGQVAFGVGARGVQADPTGRVQSIVDTQFIGRDGTRVNLEVDRPGQIRRHADDHLRAIRAAVRAGIAGPQGARSVFTVAGPDGRVREVRHVHYETWTNRHGRRRVVPVQDAHIRLVRPLAPEQIFRSGALDSPQAASRLAARQARTARRRAVRTAMRRRTRPTGRVAPVQRRRSTRRFDSFDARD